MYTITSHDIAALTCIVFATQLLEEYFGADKQLDEADAFLKSYLAQKAWKQDADSSRGGGVAGGIDNDSSSEDGGGDADDDDEAFLENLDRFEAAYNFRCVPPCSEQRSAAMKTAGTRQPNCCLPP